MSVDKNVIDDYEAQVSDLTARVGSLGADLLEATRERDVAQAAYDSLRDASIEHTERHRSIFDEHLRQVAQLTDERDEARAEVVRLGREGEKLTEERDHAREEWHRIAELYRAERNTRWAADRELVRLRTIIGELGAAEAAEPPPIDITPLLLQHPPGPVTLASLYAAADEQVEALRSEGGPP